MRIRTHANPLCYTERMTDLQLSERFSNAAPFDFEIGFGRGMFLKQYAENNPERQVIGVEVRRSVVEVVQEKLEKSGVQNVWALHGVAQICLEDIIPDNSLENIFIFHPDPWLKKRHNKRRIVNEKLLETLIQKSKPLARLHVTTDVPSLWEEMYGLLSKNSNFKQIEDDAFWQTYQTHWHLYCEREQRPLHAGIFEIQK